MSSLKVRTIMQEALRAVPFVPFEIHLDNGIRLAITQPSELVVDARPSASYLSMATGAFGVFQLSEVAWIIYIEPATPAGAWRDRPPLL